MAPLSSSRRPCISLRGGEGTVTSALFLRGYEGTVAHQRSLYKWGGGIRTVDVARSADGSTGPQHQERVGAPNNCCRSTASRCRSAGKCCQSAVHCRCHSAAALPLGTASLRCALDAALHTACPVLPPTQHCSPSGRNCFDWAQLKNLLVAKLRVILGDGSQVLPALPAGAIPLALVVGTAPRSSNAGGSERGRCEPQKTRSREIGHFIRPSHARSSVVEEALQPVGGHCRVAQGER